MLELLKTLYVFQSLDLAFSRGGMCAALAVVWPESGGGGGGAIRGWIVSVFTPPTVGLLLT